MVAFPGKHERSVVAANLVLAFLWGGTALGQAAPTLCVKAEKTIFSCKVASGRIVSVCARDLTEKGGLVQYRFGRKGAWDVSVPSTGLDQWRASAASGMLTFSGGGAAYLAFGRPPFRYVVYDGVGRGWGSKSGVAVEKAGKRIANLKCIGGALTELGPDLFQQGGFPQDKSDFELP